MKLLSRIKAFFRYRGQDAELDVSAAEIKNGRVYLHPEEDKSKVYCIRSSAVEVYISPRESISEDDVEILNAKKKEDEAPSTPSPEKQRQERSRNLRPIPLNHFTTKMKTITFSMYPEEYDMLMANMKENGYKKTEFLLACVSSAKKNSMLANYQRHEVEHKERRYADKYPENLLLRSLQAQKEHALKCQKHIEEDRFKDRLFVSSRNPKRLITADEFNAFVEDVCEEQGITDAYGKHTKITIYSLRHAKDA